MPSPYDDYDDYYDDYGDQVFRVRRGKDRSLPTIGLELEVDSGALFETDEELDLQREIQDKKEFRNLFMTKGEGSVDGFEIITHPFSYGWYSEHRPLFTKFLNFLTENGIRSDSERYNCGMHVHISRPENDIHVKRVRQMVFGRNTGSSLNKFSKAICNRPENRLSQWASLRKNGSAMRENRPGNKETLEFRLFGGTLDPFQFFVNIEHPYAIYKYTEKSNPLRLSAYKKWVVDNRDMLPNLSEYLLQRG